LAVFVQGKAPFPCALVFFELWLGFVRLPLIKDRQIQARQGIAQGAPAAVLKVSVLAVKVAEAIREEPWLALKVTAGRSGFGLDLVPLVTRQPFPFRLPVAIGASPEAPHVEGGHVRGNA
jgi:hypothetical protein